MREVARNVDSIDPPSVGGIIGEMVEAARINVKGAVSVKGRSCNAAKNSQDGKIMAYDHDRLMRKVEFLNSLQPIPNSSLHIHQSFPSRKGELCRPVFPNPHEIRIRGPNLRERQSLELSVMELAKVTVDGNSQVVRTADEISREDGSF